MAEIPADVKLAGDLLAFYVIDEWNGMGGPGEAVDEWERLTGPVINPYHEPKVDCDG